MVYYFSYFCCRIQIIQTMKKYLLISIILFAFLSMESKAQWQQTSGSAGVNVYGIVVNGSAVVAGMGSGILKSTDNGATCSLSNNGLTSTNVRAITNIGSYIFAGTFWGGGVFLSTDYGATWTPVSTGMTNKWILSLGKNYSDLFAGTSAGGVFLSGDYGSNWVAATSGITAQYTYAITPYLTKLLAGTEGGIFQSTDNGSTWTASSAGMPSGATVSAIAVSGSNIYAGTYQYGIFLSTDGGTTWTAINTGLTTNNILSFAVNGNAIYAGTNGYGVFISTNSGASWAPINTGLTDQTVYSLATDGVTMFAGTADGIFRRPIGEINAITEIPANDPVQLSAYPNPFKSQTTIQYTIPSTENVTLKIYNVIGECVGTPIEKTLGPGSYQAILNSDALTSGIYFCTLQVGETRKTIKLFLNK